MGGAHGHAGERRGYEFRPVGHDLGHARGGGDGVTVDAFRATLRALNREGAVS